MFNSKKTIAGIVIAGLLLVAAAGCGGIEPEPGEPQQEDGCELNDVDGELVASCTLEAARELAPSSTPGTEYLFAVKSCPKVIILNGDFAYCLKGVIGGMCVYGECPSLAQPVAR